MLAAFLGFAKGASERYTELTDLQVKREASLLKRMQQGRVASNQALKGSLFAMQHDEAWNMGYGRQRYESVDQFQRQNLMLGEGATAFNQIDGGDDSVINASKLLSLRAPDGEARLISWLNRPENADKYSETRERYNAAVVSEFTKLREATQTKSGGEFVTKEVEDIRTQLPQDDLTDEDLDNIDLLAAKAYLMEDPDFIEEFGKGNVNYSTRRDSNNAAVVELEDYTYRPIGDPNDQKDLKILTPQDHAPETISVFNRASRGSVRKMGLLSKTTHNLVDVYPKVSEKEVSNFVNTIAYGFDSGEINISLGGQLRSTPAALMRYRPVLSEMIKDTTLGDTVNLLTLSMPQFKDRAAKKTYGSSTRESKKLEYANKLRKLNFGLDVGKPESISRWSNENRNLEGLVANGENIIFLMEAVDADIGIGAEIPAIVSAARSGITTLADYFNVSGDIIDGLKGQLDKVSSPDFEKLSLDQKQLIVNALLKELTTQFTSSYAKILDSSLSGASRLAEGDVQRSERGLQLTRLLANPATAPYVVQSLVQRSKYQLQMNTLIVQGDAAEVAAAAFIMNHARPAQLMFNHSVEEILNDVNRLSGKEYTLEQLQTPPDGEEAKPVTGATVVDSNDARFQDITGPATQPTNEQQSEQKGDE